MASAISYGQAKFVAVGVKPIESGFFGVPERADLAAVGTGGEVVLCIQLVVEMSPERDATVELRLCV